MATFPLRLPRRDAHPWLRAYAQVGIATLSVLYLCMGALTALSAAGLGGEKADHKDVLPFLLDRPFGRGLVMALAAGLSGYILWRLWLAWADPEHREANPRNLAIRAGYVVSALFHGSLLWYAVQLLLRDGHAAQGDEPSEFARLLLQQPLGPWWVGLVAGIFAVMGLFQFWKVYTARYLKRIHDPRVARRHDKLVRGAGTVGFTARGFVFLLIGWMFLQAGLKLRAAEAGGTEKAMGVVESVPFGHFLLAVIAVGLMAYGVFLAIQAWSLQDDLAG